jgi:hypothetical protein
MVQARQSLQSLRSDCAPCPQRSPAAFRLSYNLVSYWRNVVNMAFLIGVCLTGMILYGVFWYMVDAQTRADTHKDIRQNPLVYLWVGIGLTCLMTFFWGVLIPVFGRIEVPIWGRHALELWQIGGIGFLFWLLLHNKIEARLKGRKKGPANGNEPDH